MEFVQPGDYAAYSGSYDNQLHGRHINGNGVGEPWPSFHERESMLGLSAYDPDTPLHNDMSNDIIAAVKQHDQGKCFITGSVMNTQLCWIIPPVWANECCEPSQTFSG